MRSSIIHLKFQLITRLPAYIHTHMRCVGKKAIKLRIVLSAKARDMNVGKYRYC